MEKLKLLVEPEFFLAVAILLITRQENTIGTVLVFLVLHELGHALVYGLGGGEIRCISLTPFGIRMEMGQGAGSWGWEVAAVAAGPVCNLLAAGVAYVLGFHDTGIAGMILGLYNLFPAHYLDGGLLVELISEKTACNGNLVIRVGDMMLVILLACVFLFAAWQGEVSIGLFLALILALLEYVKQ
ncbi:MAG: hypothetical protein IJF34_07165 [Clostridia bacterium]|nr:hypothetical protein [Clostridia bacterium]MBQ4624559.1 hypothetical protein [Clostridia bacterium]